MTKKDSTKQTHEYQSREIAACICELHRTAWYLSDITALLRARLQPVVEGSAHYTSVSVFEGLFDSIRLATGKQMELIESLQESSGVELDWEDLREGSTVFLTLEGPVSRTNHSTCTTEVAP